MRLTIPIKESFIALFGGILACSFGRIALYALCLISIDNPTIYQFWFNFVQFVSLPYIFLNSLWEESIKLFFLKKIKISSGILFGFGYGITETISRHLNIDSSLVDLGFIYHIIFAIILVHFIKKDRAFLGFLIVVVLHTLCNFLIVNFL